jgi:hypothetical protein
MTQYIYVSVTYSVKLKYNAFILVYTLSLE